MTAHWIYVTTESATEARNIGRALVEQGLVACANVLDGMTSIFRWQGAVQEARESVLILKTRDALVRQVVEAVKNMHSYECPCILALPISAGNPDFLAWIHEQTATPPA